MRGFYTLIVGCDQRHAHEILAGVYAMRFTCKETARQYRGIQVTIQFHSEFRV
jgi:hypothetical protein